MAAESLHHSLEFFALIIVALAIGKNTFDAGKNICEWPNWFIWSKLSNVIGKESRFGFADSSVCKDARADAGKLIDCFGDVILKVGFKKTDWLAVIVFGS